jgi:excisionase family DNA binding protein
MPAQRVPFESPIVLAQDELEEARMLADALPELIKFMESQDGGEVRLCAAGMPSDLTVPSGSLVLLHRLFSYLATNKPVEIIPAAHELTTQEAADLLNVSRPYLVKLLEANKIPFRKVGPRRRILFQDLMRFKEQEAANARKGLTDLAVDGQALGFGK